MRADTYRGRGVFQTLSAHAVGYLGLQCIKCIMYVLINFLSILCTRYCKNYHSKLKQGYIIESSLSGFCFCGTPAIKLFFNFHLFILPSKMHLEFPT